MADLTNPDTINGGVHHRYFINRLPQTTDDFEKHEERNPLPPPTTMRDFARECVQACTIAKTKQVLRGLFPFFSWIRKYNVKGWLPGDLVSGLTVGVVHIPQSMAFSLLAGLPPVFGLYTSFYPVLIYLFMGTSQHLSVGTFAVTSLLTQSVVFRFVPGEVGNATIATDFPVPGISQTDADRVEVASALMLLMGIFQLAFGIFRLGFITNYLSAPLIQAFTVGAATLVVTSQTPTILGLPLRPTSGIGAFFINWIAIFRNLPNTQVPTLVVSIVCIVLLVAGRHVNLNYKEKLKFPIPTEVIVVIIAILASNFGRFNQRFGISIVSTIPTGLPRPIVPRADILGSIVGDAFAVAIVGFAISISLAKLYSNRFGYSIQPNQELIAYGVSNVIPSFFLCFPNAAALARCEILVNTGGKSQVVSILSLVVVLVTILWIGPVFETLPRAVLGCIIVVGLIGILQKLALVKDYYKKSKIDCLIWVFSYIAVVIFGVDLGLLIAVLFSIIVVIIRTQRPKVERLGNMHDSDIYRDIKRYKAAQVYDGIEVFRFNSVLYYVNKDFFREKLVATCKVDPDVVLSDMKKEVEALRALEKKSQQAASQKNGFFRGLYKRASRSTESVDSVAESSQGSTDMAVPDVKAAKKRKASCCVVKKLNEVGQLHSIIIDCSPFTFIDLPAVNMLKSLCKSYKEIGISMILANVSSNVRDALTLNEYYEISGQDGDFISIHDAVACARMKTDEKRKEAEMENTQL